MMASTDTVREKCEERWDGTKHPTIYVWNINKTFYVLFTKRKVVGTLKIIKNKIIIWLLWVIGHLIAL